MNMRHVSIASAIALASVAFLIRAQEPADSGAVIRTETRVVLVDAVVTDKKGGYAHDLTAKDFKVFEDNKEQRVTSFSFEADPASPLNSEPRYLVLFFDNSTMNISDQAIARKAATEFIEANAGATRQMAIVNFGGSLQIAQNFTGDVERLKAVVAGIKLASTTTSSAGSGPLGQLSRAEGGFGRQDSILALRSLAKSLATVRGRKTLVLLTTGFPLNPELLTEVTATIDASNRSNVAIYPIDVRGLVANNGGHDDDATLRHASPFTPAVYVPGSVLFLPAQTGTGGTRTGGAAGGSGGGTRTPTGTSGSGPGRTTGTIGSKVAPAGVPVNANMNNAARSLVPPFPKDALTNQQVMYMLADGTGGFVIVNTNDLVGGMDKIGKEQNEYYLLGYTPPESKEGSCHTLRVKVDKGGLGVRARTGFCNAKSNDVLAKNPVEKTLETRAAAEQPGNVPATLEVPFFFTAPNLARVNIAMEIATDSLKFEKEKGKLHASVDVLGIASKQDGSVGARFTDTVNFDFESKKEVDAFKEKPYHYENQFDIASGIYKMKVAFSAGGDRFGKVERPLVVDAYDGKRFAISPIAFSTTYAPKGSADVDTALMEDRTPLTVMGLRLTPSGTNKFKAPQQPIVYFEVYEPALIGAAPDKPPLVGLQIRMLDSASGKEMADSGEFRMQIPMRENPNSPVIPWGAKIPMEELKPGSYFVVIDAVDSTGAKTARTAEFTIQ